jgi:mRNA interferase RelE/StbE
MAWKIEFDLIARRELEKLDKTVSDRILRFLHERIETLEDPRKLGECLQGTLREFWKYRVGDYRLICSLKNDRMVVVVVRVGHRRHIYHR